MIDKAKNLLRHVGVDTPILFSVLTRGWMAMYGVLSLWLVVHTLSSVLQGYYFSFLSVAGLQLLFELGLSSVMIQFLSHESAGTEASEYRHSASSAFSWRLNSLVRLCVHWYLGAATAFILVLIPVGVMFFSHARDGLSAHAWLVPWVLLVVAVALALIANGALVVVEGVGKVALVSKIRLKQSICGSMCAVAVLYLGGGLYALAVQPLVSGMVGLFATYSFVLARYRRPAAHERDSVAPLRWSAEILPLQWRTAATWACGYFISQIFVPVAFRVVGPETAGRLGLAISIISQVSAIALVWMSTKVNTFGGLIALGRIEDARLIYSKAFKQSFMVMLILSALAWLAISAIGIWLPQYQSRVLEPLEFGLLVANAVFTHLIYCQAYYVRSFKIEPYLMLSAFWAAAAILSVLLLVWQHSLVLMYLCYGAATIFVIFPWSTGLVRVFAHARLEKPVSLNKA